MPTVSSTSQHLGTVVRQVVPFLDRVIDINYYPTPEAEFSNHKWRPVGLGLMGLQDVFFKKALAFDSADAKELSQQISAHIYFHALWASTELAEVSGPHEAYEGTRVAQGNLQFDLWQRDGKAIVPPAELDWDALRARIAEHGLRNSLLIAIAPTATIASIVGCYECIEPQVSNLFKRETLSGEFMQINRYLVTELQRRGLWDEEMISEIKKAEGSVQDVERIPAELKEIYRTAWEVPQRSLIDMAAERGAFIDQSQSLNLFMETPTIGKLSSMYLHAWKAGLKTTYYLRSRPATRINQATTSGSSAPAPTVADRRWRAGRRRHGDGRRRRSPTKRRSPAAWPTPKPAKRVTDMAAVMSSSGSLNYSAQPAGSPERSDELPANQARAVRPTNILDPGFDLTLRPMRYPVFFDMYKNAIKNTWTVDEIDFSDDLVDLDRKLMPAEKHLVSRLVAFFATGDSIVSNNLVLNLYQHINAPEARMYLSRQLYEEALHVQFYLTLLDNYIPDMAEREAAFAAVENIPSIRAKAEFCFKWIGSIQDIDRIETPAQRKQFLLNLICFASCIEGLFFFAAFAYVYFLRSKGLLNGLADGTNWVFRDESAHMNFALEVVDTVRKEQPELFDAELEEDIRKMLREAVECEHLFAADVLGEGVPGMSLGDTRTYLEYVADQRLAQLGYGIEFGSKNPFSFMELQDVQGLSNFFERTVSSYQTGVAGDVAFDEEF